MIFKEEVKHIAKLARIDLDEKEIKKLQKELSGILDYFKMLEKVDTSKIEPTFHPIESFFGRSSEIMREDEIKTQSIETTNKIFEAVPKKEKRHIKVCPVRNSGGSEDI